MTLLIASQALSWIVIAVLAAVCLALARQVGVLHERIAQRFEIMLELGLIGELRKLRHEFDLNPSLPSMRAVGYRQVWQYLDGELSLAQLRDKGVAATRQLAKRQLTWLRSWPGVKSFDCLDGHVLEQTGAYLSSQL